MRRTSPISEAWQFINRAWRDAPGYLACSRLEALPAEVPGHVHVDLVRNRVIADPFEGRHELGCQWVDREEWVYFVEFTAAPSEDLPFRRLHFGGLDTVCEVRLNGELVASHDNMFVPLEVNVDNRLRRGMNLLEVHFLPAARAGDQRRVEYFRARELASDLVRFDERAFVRKAAYMFGWDWGPRLVSAGIWKPVSVIEFRARFSDVHVQQEHDDGDVTIRCVSAIEGEGTVVHFMQCPGAGTWQRLGEGSSLTLRGPALWWPVGFGSAALHEIRSFVLPAQAHSELMNFDECERVCLDQRCTRVGLRTIALEQETDQWGRSFRLKVNGQPIWCVGANWIPDHSFPSQVTKDRVREQLLRVLDMNMNMLRVWGGGVYESDEFYELCDELGILVWQDFPFACSYAPDDAAALQAVEREANSQAQRLRNHASLALWCGNNENSMMFEAKWDDATKHPERCHGEKIWEQLLPSLLTKVDPSRPYIATSPHSPDVGEAANSDRCGDQHNWEVWHGRGDWVHYRESQARFASEFGFASAPSRAAWRQTLDEAPADVAVRDSTARWHDKTKKGYETFIRYVELHYPPALNLEEWIYTSQLNQRDALCAAIEHYRRSEFCAGSLIWQLNDCWPVQSWSVLDNTGTYKAAAYALRRLYATALATLQVHGPEFSPQLRVHAVLDNCRDAFVGALNLEARDSRTGALQQRWTCSVHLTPGERKVVLDIEIGGFVATRTVFWCDFAGHSTYRLLCEPKQLETADPQWTVLYDGEVPVLRSSGPALDSWVLPGDGELTENFVSLREAGEIRLPASGVSDQVQLYWIGGKALIPLAT